MGALYSDLPSWLFIESEEMDCCDAECVGGGGGGCREERGRRLSRCTCSGVTFGTFDCLLDNCGKEN